jgi:hypothetical protein
MNAIKEVINGGLCQPLLTCITLFREQEEPLKIFTNYIYLIGNVFISLQSRLRKQDPQQYIELHAQVLAKFKTILLEVQAQLTTTNTN